MDTTMATDRPNPIALRLPDDLTVELARLHLKANEDTPEQISRNALLVDAVRIGFETMRRDDAPPAETPPPVRGPAERLADIKATKRAAPAKASAAKRPAKAAKTSKAPGRSKPGVHKIQHRVIVGSLHQWRYDPNGEPRNAQTRAMAIDQARALIRDAGVTEPIEIELVAWED